MGKKRMYEPYGYQEGEEYLSKRYQIENELAFSRETDKKEFTSVEYNADLQSFVFRNVFGKAVAQANMKDIIAQELLDITTTYDADNKKIILVFKSGQRVEIPVDDLIDVREAGDGLELNDQGDMFQIKIAFDNEQSRVDGNEYLTVDANGLKISGINLAVEKEEERAIAEETRLDEKIDAETARAKQAERDLNDLINAETARAIGQENRIETKFDTIIGTGFTTTPTETVTQRFIDLKKDLHDEADARAAADNVLQTNINNEEVAREAEISRLEGLINGYNNSLLSEIQSLKARVTALENRI